MIAAHSLWRQSIILLGVWSVNLVGMESVLRGVSTAPVPVQNQHYLRSLLDVAVYIGSGYDLLRGSPDGSSLTSGGMDPGLKVAKTILHQTKQPEGCIAEANCVQFESSTLEQQYTSDINMRSYQESHNSSWNIEGGIGLGLFKARAGRSKAAGDLNEEFYRYENVVLNERNLTIHGEIGYRYHEEKRLSNDFMYAVCQLPNHDRDKGQFLRFIKEWGTHVVTSARLGVRRTLKMFVKKSDYSKTVMQESSSSQSGSVGLGSLFSVGGSKSSGSRIVQKMMTSSVEAQTSVLEIGSEEYPAPITYTLRSLDYFQRTPYLKATATYVQDCPLLSDNEIGTIRVEQFLNDALENYPSFENVDADGLVEADRNLEPSWPEGQYSLLVQNSTVCPQDWASGNRMVTINANQPYGPGEAPTGFIEHLWAEIPITSRLHKFSMDFCTKRLEREKTGSPAFWERGSYCIFRKNDSCPEGFPGGGNLSVSYELKEGIDSYYFPHKTTGNIPDEPSAGLSEQQTVLSYCCRDDGPVNRQLFLPTNVPFMLLPMGKGCQEVVGMSAKLKSLWTNVADIFIEPVNDAGARKAGTTALRYSTTTQPATYSEQPAVNSFKLFFCEYGKTM